MTSPTTQPQKPPAHVGVMQLLSASYIAGAVSCLAQMGIPDLVEAGPKSANELASQIGARSEQIQMPSTG
jgi:hypothetical protein